jgi:plastocyanin
MRSWLLIPLIIAVPAAVPAQQPQPAAVDVRLSSFKFEPSTIRLHAGQPVTLRLTNGSSGGHNFSAPEFFAAATIAPGQNVAIREGTIEVPHGQTVTLQLTPARGTYRLRCTHTLHTSFGMRGEIVVE